MSFFSSLKRFFGLASGPTKLSPGDRLLQCLDCKGDFVFDKGEQEFFKSKGFTDPKRCPHCRKKVKYRMKKERQGGNGHGGRGHQEKNSNQGQRGGGGGFFHRKKRREESPYVDDRY